MTKTEQPAPGNSRIVEPLPEGTDWRAFLALLADVPNVWRSRAWVVLSYCMALVMTVATCAFAFVDFALLGTTRTIPAAP